MSSLLYKTAEFAASLLSHKNIYSLDARGLEAYLNKQQGKQNLEPPRYIRRNFSAERAVIDGCVCWIIGAKNNAASKNNAVLFIHGGGFIAGAHAIHWRAVSKIIQRLHIPVWVPLYPLYPVSNMEEAATHIASIYKQMLCVYKSDDIVALGDSAGAALGLVLCHHIKASRLASPMPRKLILVSPGMLTEQDPQIVLTMKAIEKKDALLSYNFITTMTELYDIDPSPSNYIAAPLYGDFCGFPPLCVFSGTHDLFFPQIPPFVERVKQAGADCQFIRGEQMMHVWPYIPFSRECASAFEQIIKFVET